MISPPAKLSVQQHAAWQSKFAKTFQEPSRNHSLVGDLHIFGTMEGMFNVGGWDSYRTHLNPLGQLKRLCASSEDILDGFSVDGRIIFSLSRLQDSGRIFSGNQPALESWTATSNFDAFQMMYCLVVDLPL